MRAPCIIANWYCSNASLNPANFSEDELQRTLRIGNNANFYDRLFQGKEFAIMKGQKNKGYSFKSSEYPFDNETIAIDLAAMITLSQRMNEKLMALKQYLGEEPKCGARLK